MLAKKSFVLFIALSNFPIFANATWPSYWYFSKSLAAVIILPAFAVEALLIKAILRGSFAKSIMVCAIANAGTTLLGYFYLKAELSRIIWLNLPITAIPFSPRDMVIHAGVILFLNTVAEFLIYKVAMYRINVWRILLGSFTANLSSLSLTLAILSLSK